MKEEQASKNRTADRSEDKQEKSKRRYLPYIYIIAALLLISLLIYQIPFSRLWKKSPISFSQNEEYMTVFVHGTFGSLLGLLSLFQTLQDNVSGTTYKKVVGKMRKDPFFYNNQPMMQKGLVKIDSSQAPRNNEKNKPAIYPIVQAYQEIESKIAPNSKNHFYTFGWSGLMSQKRRRFEAIRFYNAISEEIEEYKKQGINPKLRIIAHSHGGNLTLNFGAIKKIVNNLDQPGNIEKTAHNNDEKESLENMFQEIKNLKTKKEITTQVKPSKRYDYIPVNKVLVIDQFIMLGTPIQPETESFAFYDPFKKVYSLYSGEDVIQSLDWASTKRYYSDQRFNLLSFFTTKKEIYNKVIQAKIMVGRQNQSTKTDVTKTNTLVAANNSDEKQETPSFWGKLLSGKNPFSKQTPDPTHKELWFMSWDQNKNKINDLLSPLPTVVIIPLFLSAMEKIDVKINDIDLNIKQTKNNFTLSVLKHNDKKQQAKSSIPLTVIERTKEKILDWKPEDLSHTTEFNIITKYCSNF